MDRIIDIGLVSQDKEGFFAPTPGGWACYDYDAVHILAKAHGLTSYRKAEIEECLEKARRAIFYNYNGDGGFCHSNCEVTFGNFITHIPVYLSGKSPYLWYYRARYSFADLVKQRSKIHEGWTAKGRRRNESDLWDTWFRCLAVAEIDKTLNDTLLSIKIPWKFHDMIGLGNY